MIVVVVLVVVAAVLVVAVAASGGLRRRPPTSPVTTGTESVLDRYEIHQPQVTSPYTIDGKLAPPMRWKGPGALFLIWDRQRENWVDAAFITRADAERRLDELTKSVGVASWSRRRAVLPWRASGP